MNLTATERGAICTIADDEQAWTVFTDSARLTRRLLRTATQVDQILHAFHDLRVIEHARERADQALELVGAPGNPHE